MAHFVRPLVLAAALDSSWYDIHFYAPRRFFRYLEGKPFTIGALATMPGERFLENISKGAPVFPSDVVRDYVRQDRQLIAGIEPDLVIGDMRPSLPISSRLEGRPWTVIMNAYWSPYAKRRSILPSIPLTQFVSPRLLGPIYKVAEPLAHAVHVGQMNRVRKEFGIPALPPDLRVMYTEGTYVLYPDVPEFVPTRNRPEGHHYVGACQWTLPAPLPGWWDRMVEDPKPKVFVSLGSSGALRVLPPLLKALSRLPVSILLSTSGRDLPVPTRDVYMSDLLPLAEAAAKSGVVVSHGGSSGVYPAIAAGTPVLGLPANADQQLSTAVLEDSGAGLGVRVEEASEKRLLRTLEKLLSEPQYRLAAQKWAAIFSRYDTGDLFRRFVGGALGVPVP